MKIDGSCHCGFIKYEAEVNPEEVYVCHCTDCQSISGSPFRWAVSVPEEDFRLLSGEPKTYVKTADSGSTSHQLFCPECASPLYSTSIGDGPKFYNLRLGTARQRAELRPKLQVWCGSAQEWVAVQGPTKQFGTQKDTQHPAPQHPLIGS
jgi:hypothetical protein